MDLSHSVGGSGFGIPAATNRVGAISHSAVQVRGAPSPSGVSVRPATTSIGISVGLAKIKLDPSSRVPSNRP